ncbi:hypothetical protein MRX96_031145 [Rhipicephalus microplus]
MKRACTCSFGDAVAPAGPTTAAVVGRLVGHGPFEKHAAGGRCSWSTRDHAASFGGNAARCRNDPPAAASLRRDDDAAEPV